MKIMEYKDRVYVTTGPSEAIPRIEPRERDSRFCGFGWRGWSMVTPVSGLLRTGALVFFNPAHPDGAETTTGYGNPSHGRWQTNRLGDEWSVLGHYEPREYVIWEVPPAVVWEGPLAEYRNRPLPPRIILDGGRIGMPYHECHTLPTVGKVWPDVATHCDGEYHWVLQVQAQFAWRKGCCEYHPAS